MAGRPYGKMVVYASVVGWTGSASGGHPVTSTSTIFLRMLLTKFSITL